MAKSNTTVMRAVAPIFSRNDELATAIASGDIEGVASAMAVITTELQESLAGVPYVQANVAKHLKKTVAGSSQLAEVIIDYVTSDGIQNDLKADMKSPLGQALIASVQGPVLDHLVEEGVESKVVSKATETKLRKLGIIS